MNTNLLSNALKSIFGNGSVDNITSSSKVPYFDSNNNPTGLSTISNLASVLGVHKEINIFVEGSCFVHVVPAQNSTLLFQSNYYGSSPVNALISVGNSGFGNYIVTAFKFYQNNPPNGRIYQKNGSFELYVYFNNSERFVCTAMLGGDIISCEVVSERPEDTTEL